MPHRTRPLIATMAIAIVLSLALAACGSSSKSGSPSDTTGPGGSTSPSSSGATTTLRLGYFPNVTHAPAIIGAQSGSFQAKLGPNVKLVLKTFNSGTEATTALLAGAIEHDGRLLVELTNPIGPGPLLNGSGPGTGLIGLTERVRLTGGELDHAVGADGEELFAGLVAFGGACLQFGGEALQ